MCTSFTLGDKQTGRVYGRTMEFTLDLRSEIMVIPAGTTLTGTDKNAQFGEGGLSWQTKYAAVGANGIGLPIILDGVNEKGLVVGVLNFPASAQYLEVSDADQSKSNPQPVRHSTRNCYDRSRWNRRGRRSCWGRNHTVDDSD
jgi:choloylglycine hydrolase